MGYIFNDYFRAGITIQHPSFSKMNFKPYIMGGIGVSRNTTSDIFWPLAVQTEFGARATQFAWQAGLGALLALNNAWALDFNYSFVSLGEVTNSGQYNAVAANNTPAFGAPTKFSTVYSNQFEIGVHYRF